MGCGKGHNIFVGGINMSSCCCCHCCHCCGCCGCGCGCGSSCPDQDVGGVSLTEFPVYVSYPAFFPAAGAVEGANQAIFDPEAGIMPLTGSRVLARGTSRSCGCRRS